MKARASRDRCRGAGGALGVAALVVCMLACDRARVAPGYTADSTPLTLRIGTALPGRGIQGVGVPTLVEGLVSEALLTVDRNGKLQSRLCDRWEWLENGRLLKVTLAAGVLFHDGSPLTAHVAAAVLRQRFARNDVLAYRSVTRVVAEEPQTVSIHLARPEAFLPEDLTEVRFTTGPGGAIGTGPFIVEGDVADLNPQTQPVALRAFDGYRLGRPEVRRIEIGAYPTLRAAWTAMMRGEIEMLHEVGRDAAGFVKDETSVRSYEFLRPYTTLLAFNVRHPILGRRDVRQALTQAVDRTAIVRDGMAGQGEPASGPVWKYHWAHSTAQRTHSYNPEAARLRLDAAGYPERRTSTASTMPSRFSFKCLMFGDDPRFERVAVVLQKQLYDIGVDMQIEAVPLKEMVERMAAGRFDAFFFEMISSRSLTWTHRIWHSRSNVRWFNSGHTAADAALDRLREVFTEPETRAAVSELQRTLYEDPPAIFLAWPTTTRAVAASIEVPYEDNIDVFGRVWNFQRAKTTQARR